MSTHVHYEVSTAKYRYITKTKFVVSEDYELQDFKHSIPL